MLNILKETRADVRVSELDFETLSLSLLSLKQVLLNSTNEVCLLKLRLVWNITLNI